jgi:predicted RNase H-like HicB family nuclease
MSNGVTTILALVFFPCYLSNMATKRRTSVASRNKRRAKGRSKKSRKKLHLTAVLEKENKGYISLCPEFDIISKGKTPNQSLDNLKQAVKLFLKHAQPQQVRACIHNEILITRFEAFYG